MSSTDSKITTNYPTLIGALIGQMRKDQGISQADFATRIGIGQPTWSKIEKGTSGLSFEQLVRAAELLDTRASELVRRAEDLAADLERQNVTVNPTRPDSPSPAMIFLGAAALAALVIAATRKK